MGRRSSKERWSRRAARRETRRIHGSGSFHRLPACVPLPLGPDRVTESPRLCAGPSSRTTMVVGPSGVGQGHGLIMMNLWKLVEDRAWGGGLSRSGGAAGAATRAYPSRRPSKERWSRRRSDAIASLAAGPRLRQLPQAPGQRAPSTRSGPSSCLSRLRRTEPPQTSVPRSSLREALQFLHPMAVSEDLRPMMMTLWKLVEDRAWAAVFQGAVEPPAQRRDRAGRGGSTAPAASTGPSGQRAPQLGPDRVRVSAVFGGRASPNQRSDS